MVQLLEGLPVGRPADGLLLAPVDPALEVWAAGVTYLRSREAREAESQAGDVYERVYGAQRPEIFVKAPGWRAVGHATPVRIRGDSRWNVPEPELTIVVNGHQEIVGFCAGNDVSSRDIEGENPLYLPQAKTYDGSCALGPGIQIAGAGELRDLPIQLAIQRQGETVFRGETRVSRMKRALDELVAYLFRELAFPHGVLLMTGTGIVPPDEFTLLPGDAVQIKVGSLTLENKVEA
jgi:2-dehydro-3-deoxy-D-arabinonate dehydratase